MYCVYRIEREETMLKEIEVAFLGGLEVGTYGEVAFKISMRRLRSFKYPNHAMFTPNH